MAQNSTNQNSRLRKKIRLRMFDECGGRCFYCDEPMILSTKPPGTHPRTATFDHIVPRIDGGERAWRGNLVLACFACNNKRGRRCAFEYLAEVRSA